MNTLFSYQNYYIRNLINVKDLFHNTEKLKVNGDFGGSEKKWAKIEDFDRKTESRNNHSYSFKKWEICLPERWENYLPDYREITLPRYWENSLTFTTKSKFSRIRSKNCHLDLYHRIKL